MRILVTNDDGIGASQLLPLVRWCQKLGDVTTVVPKVEQSGKSHGIEIHKPFEAKQVQLAPDVTAWAVDSTPADCVRFAVLGLGLEFDLVISGVNRGLNIGSDAMYSGTVGAACEAVNLGIQAIALSTSPKYYDNATTHLDWIFDYVQQHELLTLNNIYNINIPPEPKEIRITRQGGPYYSDDFQPEDNDLYCPKGIPVYQPSNCCFDTDTVLTNRQISVMPLTIQRVDLAVYDQLKSLNEG